jgi:PfaB family protein
MPHDPLRIPEIWKTMVVLAGAAEIDAAIADEPRVYRTIVNGPGEVVIAGDGEACERVVARLGARAVSMPFNMPVHCAPIASERAAIAACHRLKLAPQPGIEFLNLHRSPLPMERDAIADAIAGTYTSPVDFPVLIEQAYERGARIFVELGARRMCSSWIDATLDKRPHASIPFDVKGAEPAITLLRAIARLTTHRVPLDLSWGGR